MCCLMQTVRVGSYEEALNASKAAESATTQHLAGSVSATARRQPTVKRPGWHSNSPNIVKYVDTKQPGGPPAVDAVQHRVVTCVYIELITVHFVIAPR